MSKVLAVLVLLTSIVLTDGASAEIPADVPSADDCSEIRLDQTVMKGIPIQDQDGTNTCYAFAAAQMIDAYRASQKDTDFMFKTSPLALAIEAKATEQLEKRQKADPKYMIGWGTVGDAVRAANAQPVCSHWALRSTYWKDSDSASGGTLRKADVLLDGLREYFDRYEAQRKLAAGKPASSKWESPLSKQDAADKISCHLSDLGYSPSVLPPTEVLEAALDSSNFLLFLRTLSRNLCKGKTKKVSTPPIEGRGWDDYAREVGSSPAAVAKRFKKELHARLSKPGALPVAALYCDQVLKDASFDRTKRSGPCGMHISVVIGRKKFGDQCRFLVRNSWGTSCADAAEPKYCDYGQHWIDEDRFTRAMEGIEYFADPAGGAK